MATSFKYGVTIDSGGLTVTADGATITAGGLTVTAGGATITAGGLTVTAGGAAIAAGGLTVGGIATTPSKKIAVSLTATANATAYTGVMACQEDVTVTAISVAFFAAPSSAGGTVTLAVTNYDTGSTAADNLLSTATVDLEALTDKTASDLTLTATTADLSLENGDYVYATIVSDNADMADGTGGVLIIDVTPA
jgi:hypothetical protein